MAISTQSSDESSIKTDFPSLMNHFLVAMPGLEDPFFKQTVSYIIQHDEQGAMGVMLNQPMPIQTSELLEQLGFNPNQGIPQQDVLSGGPVQIQRGFVLHRPHGEWESSMPINKNVAITTSLDILEAIANDQGPEEYQLLLGYAGWDAGQLDQEMLDNSWLTVPANEELLFETAVDERWHKASELIGIDINRLTNNAGHG